MSSVAHRNRYLVGTANCYYNINLKAMLSEEGSFADLSVYIDHLEIYEDYTNNAFPILRIDFSFNNSTLKLINEKFDTCDFLFSLYSYNSKDESEGGTPLSRIVYENIVISALNWTRVECDYEYVENDTSRNILKSVDFAVKNNIILNKAINKKIYHDTTITDIVVDLFDENHPDDNYALLLQTSDRTGNQAQVMINNKNYVDSMYYLQDIYGIYRGGLSMFFGMNRGYIMSMDNLEPLVEGEEKGNVNVYVSESLFDQKQSIGITQDESSIYIRTINTGVYSEMDRLDQEINADNIMVVSHSTTNAKRQFEVDNKTTKDYGYGKEKKEIKINKFENDFYDISYQKMITYGYNTIMLKFTDMDMRALTLNKLFHVTYDKPELSFLNGKYRLHKNILSFNKIGNSNFRYSANIYSTMYRIESI